MTDQAPAPLWLQAARNDHWLEAAKIAALDRCAPTGFVLNAAIIAVTETVISLENT